MWSNLNAEHFTFFLAVDQTEPSAAAVLLDGGHLGTHVLLRAAVPCAPGLYVEPGADVLPRGSNLPLDAEDGAKSHDRLSAPVVEGRAGHTDSLLGEVAPPVEEVIGSLVHLIES